jgi:Predicted membrane protein
MTFGQSIQTVFRKYAEFNGRASRSEFWWFALFSTLVSLGLSSIFPGLAGAWFFAVLLPSFAVSVRRLRDAGLAWQWLFFILLPFVGAIILIVLYAQPSKPEAVVTEVPPTRVPREPGA